MPLPLGDRAICWLRRDLRLSDHRALFEATQRFDHVVVAFVFDRVILDALKDLHDRRISFIQRSLRELAEKLHALGSELVVLHGDPVDCIPSLAAHIGARAVFAARDYEPYALKRDSTAEALLGAQGIEFSTFKDTVIFEQGEVLSGEGKPYTVYTPYSKAWRKRFSVREDAAPFEPDLTHLAPADALSDLSDPWELSDLGFGAIETLIAPGEDAARERLISFMDRVDDYGETRDYPARNGTSTISADLRFGTLSIREAVRAAVERGTPGANKWFAELIWREFYQDILANHPHVAETAFKPAYQDLVWPGTDENYLAWEKGQTGYPIVDAAMRCLNATGLMPNRLRMVVASFLTKDLLVDYRRGEAYFARKLLDFDLASNNGGWQWAASTGCDAQPYFRVFNPYLQSAKFDPEGKFIRQWVPEVAGLPVPDIHNPSKASMFELVESGVELGVSYPWPIVDHDVQRPKAIALLDKRV